MARLQFRCVRVCVCVCLCCSVRARVRVTCNLGFRLRNIKIIELLNMIRI